MPGIYHIKSPAVPQFRFEWHPETKRVYVIRIGTVPEMADPFAFEIENEGAATNATLIWLRGFREGSATMLTGDGKLVKKENAE